MKGILIDPFERKVSEVELTGDYKEIYKHIHCDTFDAVRIENGDACFVDDNGLFMKPKNQDEQRYFMLSNYYPEPLAGYGLVLGTNSEGESVSHSFNSLKEFIDKSDLVYEL